MNILVIKTSNRELSISNQLADMILQEYQKNNMDSCNVQVLDASDLPHIDAIYVENLRNPANNLLQSNSLDLSDTLIGQLDHADVVIIATPMHNFTIPSSLKAWIDHIVRIGKTFTATSQGKMGRLADRPVYIAVSTGGMLRDKQPDFLTHYLQTIFATIGISSVYFFVMEGTVFGEEHVKQEWAQIKHKVRNHFSKN